MLRGLVTLAIGKTVILLHPPLALIGFSTWMGRACQQKMLIYNAGHTLEMGW